jgi:hypothetical protein
MAQIWHTRPQHLTALGRSWPQERSSSGVGTLVVTCREVSAGVESQGTQNPSDPRSMGLEPRWIEVAALAPIVPEVGSPGPGLLRLDPSLSPEALSRTCFGALRHEGP